MLQSGGYMVCGRAYPFLFVEYIIRDDDRLHFLIPRRSKRARCLAIRTLVYCHEDDAVLASLLGKAIAVTAITVTVHNSCEIVISLV